MAVSLTGTAAPPGGGTRGIGVVCRGVVHIYRLEGYDVVALAGVDLDISPGDSVALLGPSGSGKSTLLAVLAGLLRPAAGRVEVGGYDLVKATTAQLHRMRATDVGVALQGASRNLLPYLSAEQNVRFAQDGAPQRRDLPSPREILALVGLDTRARTRLRPAELTPGERQRVALAVALANRPGLLLADEPTSQLDRSARDEVVAALEEVRRTGTTVVIVTHDPEVGAGMRRTVTIRDGRVGSEGRLGEEYSVVGRDGAVHLPPEILQMLAPGTLLRVHAQADGTVLLVPAGDRAHGPDPQVPPVPGPADPQVPVPGSVGPQPPAPGPAGRPGPAPASGPEPRPSPAPHPRVPAGQGTPPQVRPGSRDPADPGAGAPAAPAGDAGARPAAGGRVRRPQHLGEMLASDAVTLQPSTPAPTATPDAATGYAPAPDTRREPAPAADPGAAGVRPDREEAR
ncbi:MAG TPA: ATP-binding cassette domain-containing protein [Natronosporangium sp.]|nr:ATP-binding cassette domain-containing protein [Natronosporangium sp.]